MRKKYIAIYNDLSPSLMVLGVACVITSPTSKSSKKRPLFDFILLKILNSQYDIIFILLLKLNHITMIRYF